MNQYEFHPAANIFPIAEGSELDALAADIKAFGQHQPVILHEGKILDGRRRYLACLKAEIEPKFLVWDGKGSPVDFVVSANVHRRHLNQSQRAIAALRLLPLLAAEAKDRQRLSNGRGKKGAHGCAGEKGKSASLAAKLMGCCPRQVEKAKAIQAARPDLIEQVETGETTLSKAYAAFRCASRGLDCTVTPPSLCFWIWKQLRESGYSPRTILDPCAGTGNLTKPFTDEDQSVNMVAFETKQGTNFLQQTESIECDLVVCNPPFAEWETFLKKIVEVVGNQTPIIFICPQDSVLGFKNTKNGWYQWLNQENVPHLSATTCLPKGSFVEALSASVILWFNLPEITGVGMVPPEFLVAKHDWTPPENSQQQPIVVPSTNLPVNDFAAFKRRLPLGTAHAIVNGDQGRNSDGTPFITEPPASSSPKPTLRIAAIPDECQTQITLHCGDSLTVLRSLPADSVDCCVTSVPYYLLRDYGCEGQYGLEPSVGEWVSNLLNVFREVRRLLRNSGTCWLNVGDPYAYGTGSFNSHGRKRHWTPSIAEARRQMAQHRPVHAKSLMFAPHRLAVALAEDGWIGRAEIILQKGGVDGCKDRPIRTHEYLYLFTKTTDYYFDADSLRVAYSSKTSDRGHSASPRCRKSESVQPEYELHPLGKLRGSVWHAGPASGAGDHPAPMPLQIAVDCVRAGCPIGGTVLDPFVGSGTTAVASAENARNCIGIDLNRSYLDIAKTRVPGARMT